MNKLQMNLMFAAFVFSANSIYAQLNPLAIGTIHPGDSIVIIYDVTINNPLVPPTTTQISNQGAVAGSNFTTVLSDDPDSGPVNDPTITLLNQFPLPVTLTAFSAAQSGTSILLNWKVETEYNLEKYVIERSADGRTFAMIGEVPGRNIPGVIHYSFDDVQPLHDNNFYRLRMVDTDGTFKYSSIVKVKIGDRNQSIYIFPNPVIGKSLNIQLQNMKHGMYSIRLYNSYGQLVLTKQVNHPGGSATQLLFLPETLTKGFYQMEIFHNEGRSGFKLIVQ